MLVDTKDDLPADTKDIFCSSDACVVLKPRICMVYNFCCSMVVCVSYGGRLTFFFPRVIAQLIPNMMFLWPQMNYFCVLYEILLFLYCVLHEILLLSTLKRIEVMKYSCCWLGYCIINYYDVKFVTHIAMHKYVAIVLYKIFSLPTHGRACN
jgi:hypothetical protein